MPTNNTNSDFFSSIPEFSSESRALSLYGQIPDKSVNPVKHSDMLQFWSNTIKQLLRYKKTLSFSFDTLKLDLKKDGLVPLALEPVLNSLIAERGISKLEELEGVGWGNWLWGQVFGAAKTISPAQKWVDLDILKETGEKYLTKREELSPHGTLTDQLLLLEHVQKELKEDLGLSFEDQTLLINHLIQTKKAEWILDPLSKQKVGLKVARLGSPVAGVTDVDKGIMKLKQVVSLLQRKIEKLNLEAQECRKKALDYKTRGQKPAALAQLKKSKMITSSVCKYENSLTTLFTVLDSIETQDTDIQVYEAYKEGTKTLRQMVHKSGITVEKVEEVTADLETLLEDQKEAEEAMASIGGFSSGEVDEDELQNELNQLLEDSDEPSPVKLPSLSTLDELSLDLRLSKLKA